MADFEAIFELDEQEKIDCVFEINATVYNYEALDKKPQINGETLIGDKSSSDLHLASEQGLLDEIENRQSADIEFADNLSELDSKVDGINANLTQQIEETQQDVNDKYNELVRDIDDLTDVVEEDYNTLNTRITNVADELQQSIEENVVALQQEDTALQNQINTQNQTLTNHNTRITANANAIAQEVTNRQNADDNLQEQIDGITAGSDVKDIVGTYAELQNYDKSKLSDNDIIKVLQDETQENASTYYRYVASTQTFSYIGKEGPFYTKSETDTLLNDKQNIIDDLVTIRNNASDGKMANETISTYGDIVTHNADEFQEKLVSGTNIKTLNNESLLGEGNIDITSAQWGNIEGDIDNQTDLKNALDLKQNITDNNLVTLDKTVVGAVNELDSKIRDIQLFKFPDTTIIGTPTINNGQVSNFSSQNYLILPFAFDTKDRAFEINMAFTTGSNVTSNQNLLGGNYCIALLLEGGVLKFRASNNGTSWNVADITTSLTVQANTNYFVKIEFNKLNYKVFYSTNGEDYTQIGYQVSTLFPRHGQVFIGVGNNQFNPFLGIINLNKTYIKLNNSIIWQGMDDAGLATRADISLSNLDELGQAKFDAKQDIIEDLESIRTNANLVSTKQDIITDLDEIRSNATIGAGLAPQVAVNTQRIEDLTTAKFPNVVIIGTPHVEGGQVSNYSDSNYLQFPFVDISRGLPFDIYFSFTTGANVTTQQNILDSYFGIALAIQNGKGIMALSSNGSSWDIGTSTGANTLLPNTTYYVKYSWTGTQYNASLSLNDKTYVPDMTLNSNLSPYKTTIFIGGSPNLFGAGTAHPFQGTINFNKSKVVVNGITVWEGMADVGLASRANVSLNNLDEVGEARFNAKQDVITDIDTIRSGASKGATALQSIPSEYVTETELQAYHDNTKQNKLIEGENITIEGDVISAKGGGGLEVGDIGISLFVDESKGLRRYLNGSIVAINDNTQGFLDRLKQIRNTNPEYFTDEQNWQAEALLNVDGCVYKFVIDETAGTIRLPKYPEYVEITNDKLPIAGNEKAIGITNGAGNYGLGFFSSATYAGLAGWVDNYGKDISTTGGVSGTRIPSGSIVGLTTDSAKSGIETTGGITKLKLRYFIQIATGQETQVDIVNEIQLNNPFSLGDSKYSPNELDNISWLKSNGQWNSGTVYVDFYNAYVGKIGQAFGQGTIKAVGDSTITDYDLVIDTANTQFRLPLLDGSESILGSRYINLDLPVSGGTIVAPANGTYFLQKGATATNQNVALFVGDKDSQEIIAGNRTSPAYATNGAVSAKVKRGDILTVVYSAVGATGYFRFTYDKGNGSLYYYVGETVQNANLVDVGRIEEKLVDLIPNNSNLITNYCTPDYENGIALSFTASGLIYTAPDNGYLSIRMLLGGGIDGYVKVNDITALRGNSGASSYFGQLDGQIVVRKGDLITATGNYDTKSYYAYFYPMKGAN